MNKVICQKIELFVQQLNIGEYNENSYKTGL